IQQLFEEQVEKSRDSIALVGAAPRVCPVSLTFRQLNEKSDRLAGLLIEKGVLSDTIVGIMMERSIDLVVVILGILKSGGAYLPIDPDYPQERIDYMLNDSKAKLTINYEFLKEAPQAPRHSSSFIIHHSKLYSNLAYIIYTSGSTGTPKGVMINQNSVVNLLVSMQDEYPFTPGDTYLLKTAYIFDVSVTELFGWFMGGGRLAVLEKNGERDPQIIFKWIESHHVTHINFVPSMFNAFVSQLDHKNINRLSSLKYILLAGEELLPEFITKFRGLNTSIKIENIYGPTESSVYSSNYSTANWNGNGSIPIGKPMPNIRLYIFDRYNHNQLQPTGIVGELIIAGIGLARGYLNNPELTAEKFGPQITQMTQMSQIKNKSFCGGARGAFYKTGDLARWHEDGNIQFLGRIDHQVKIRGFRIEMEEIEQKLLSFDGIEASAIIVRNEKDENFLCAYFKSNRELEIKEIRNYLAKQLPNYMIPSYFNRIENIPLTLSGKIDRKALALIDHKGNREIEYIAPQNEIEKKVAAIWKEVLKIEQVGIYDNFFNIGGNSLKLITLSAKLNTALGTDIPIA
ncbi:MAG TPA: non-ribosomal peptide synthetase, partial [Candidatus Kapabacteria bacterium]|nr:non-ribosomal peptide synthetase [Candidatus Kapabacteria bacterium]